MGAIAAAVALAGCGGSSHQSSSGASASESPSSSLPAGSPGALRSIHGRALRAGELQGFSPQGQLTLATNARSWVAGEELTPEQSAAEVASLQARGFVKGVGERLTSSVPGAEAISTVLQFRTPQGAAGEVATQFKQALTHGQSASAVPSIPGARGFGSGTDFNVAFSAGPYYYLVGYSSPSSATTHAQLIAAARSLYARVRGTTSPAA